MATLYYIDGYNVIYRSTVLRPLAFEAFESARDGLIEKVSRFCASTGYRAKIVFDGRGHSHDRELPPCGSEGLSIVFTPEKQTADMYIERAVYNAPHRLSIVVVSGDHGIRDLCKGMGSLVMDPDNFLSQVYEAGSQVSSFVTNRLNPKSSNFVEDRLDEGTLKALTSLRDSLEQEAQEKRKKP